MIIACNNCNKKFEINADLIPKEGRLLQCSSCNHKWFFKIETSSSQIKPSKNENIKIFEKKNVQKGIFSNNGKKSNIKDNSIISDKKVVTDISIKNNQSRESKNLLNFIIVIVISFAALIILIDTFKYPLSSIFPNIEFLLYNLYESFKDIKLFFKDLI